jgi:hypothetical protein
MRIKCFPKRKKKNTGRIRIIIILLLLYDTIMCRTLGIDTNQTKLIKLVGAGKIGIAQFHPQECYEGEMSGA